MQSPKRVGKEDRQLHDLLNYLVLSYVLKRTDNYLASARQRPSPNTQIINTAMIWFYDHFWFLRRSFFSSFVVVIFKRWRKGRGGGVEEGEKNENQNDYDRAVLLWLKQPTSSVWRLLSNYACWKVLTLMGLIICRACRWRCLPAPRREPPPSLRPLTARGLPATPSSLTHHPPPRPPPPPTERSRLKKKKKKKKRGDWNIVLTHASRVKVSMDVRTLYRILENSSVKIGMATRMVWLVGLSVDSLVDWLSFKSGSISTSNQPI